MPKAGVSVHDAVSGLDVDSLTRDECVALGKVIDDILGHTCGCAINKAGEGKSLPFEESMAELLLSNWAYASKGAQEVAIKRIAAQEAQITESQIARIIALMEAEIDKKFVQPTARKAPEIWTGSYRLAKRRVLRGHSRKIVYNAFDDVAIEWLHEHHMFWIGDYFNRHVSKSIADTISEGIEEGLGRDALGDRLKNFFDEYPGVRSKPDTYWQGMAANGMNRAQNFGEVAGYEEVGVRTLLISNPRDERTSPICRELAGREIPVKAVASQRDRLMAAEDPEDVKSIAPWLRVDQIKGKPTSEIIPMGIGAPPYHFFCRTILVEQA